MVQDALEVASGGAHSALSEMENLQVGTLRLLKHQAFAATAFLLFVAIAFLIFAATAFAVCRRHSRCVPVPVVLSHQASLHAIPEVDVEDFLSDFPSEEAIAVTTFTTFAHALCSHPSWILNHRPQSCSVSCLQERMNPTEGPSRSWPLQVKSDLASELSPPALDTSEEHDDAFGEATSSETTDFEQPDGWQEDTPIEDPEALQHATSTLYLDQSDEVLTSGLPFLMRWVFYMESDHHVRRAESLAAIRDPCVAGEHSVERWTSIPKGVPSTPDLYLSDMATAAWCPCLGPTCTVIGSPIWLLPVCVVAMLTTLWVPPSHFSRNLLPHALDRYPRHPVVLHLSRALAHPQQDPLLGVGGKWVESTSVSRP